MGSQERQGGALTCMYVTCYAAVLRPLRCCLHKHKNIIPAETTTVAS